MSDYNDSVKEQHDELLNECNATVIIAGISFDPAQILEELDPVAYRCSLADFESELEEEEV